MYLFGFLLRTYAWMWILSSTIVMSLLLSHNYQWCHSDRLILFLLAANTQLLHIQSCEDCYAPALWDESNTIQMVFYPLQYCFTLMSGKAVAIRWMLYEKLVILIKQLFWSWWCIQVLVQHSNFAKDFLLTRFWQWIFVAIRY